MKTNAALDIFKNRLGKNITVKYFVQFDHSKMIYNITGTIIKTLGLEDVLIAVNGKNEIVPIKNIIRYEMGDNQN